MLVKVRGLLLAKKSHAKRERANSEYPFTVAVMTGELIVSRKKFLQFAQCFYNKVSQFSVKLRDPLLDDNAWLPQLVVSKKFVEDKFFARNFRKLVFDCENRENFCLPKISHLNSFSHQLECLHGYEVKEFYYTLYSSHQMGHISSYKAFSFPLNSLFRYSVLKILKCSVSCNITLNMKSRFT